MRAWVLVVGVTVYLGGQVASQCSPSPCGINTQCDVNAAGAAVCRQIYPSIYLLQLYVSLPFCLRTTKVKKHAIPKNKIVLRMKPYQFIKDNCTLSCQLQP